MLKELKIHHREIGRLRFEGFTPAEIAERTGTKLATVYNILRDPMCKSYMDGLADKADKSVVNVRQRLAEMNPLALDSIQDLLQKESNAPHAVILAAAKDVLDRNGYKAPERHEHAVGHFTMKDLLELQNRAKTVNTDYMN